MSTAATEPQDMEIEGNGESSPMKRAKIEDQYETNSELGPISAEDFETMMDLISLPLPTPSQDPKPTPDQERNTHPPIIQMSSCFSTTGSSALLMEQPSSPIIWAGYVIPTPYNCTSPTYKCHRKNDKGKYGKYHSSHLKTYVMGSCHE